MIYIIAPGPLKYPFVKEGLNYFLARISHWVKIEAKFPRVKRSYENREARLKVEEEALRKALPKETYLILLDERGERLSTKELSTFLQEKLTLHKNLTFLVGGPEGISPSLKEEATFWLSLSPLTLNHEIALLVLAEALYRAISLLKGHPYHRE